MLNGMSYVSGDIGRAARVNLGYRHDSRWVGRQALKNSRSITGFNFLFGELAAVQRKIYRRYPRFVASMERVNGEYNDCCDRMDKMERQGKIVRVAPSKPVTVSRLEPDMEKLGDLYYLGYRDAKNNLPRIKKYLGVI